MSISTPDMLDRLGGKLLRIRIADRLHLVTGQTDAELEEQMDREFPGSTPYFGEWTFVWSSEFGRWVEHLPTGAANRIVYAMEVVDARR